jgi:hypothetical protein
LIFGEGRKSLLQKLLEQCQEMMTPFGDKLKIKINERLAN